MARGKLRFVPQMEAAECGAACLTMILGYFGRHEPLAAIREACGVSRDGASAKAIVLAAEARGLAARGLRLEPEDLSRLEHPTIIHWQMNHFVVLKRWSAGAVELYDPAFGPRRVSRSEFDEGFTGVCLEFQPTPQFATRARAQSSVGHYQKRLSAARGPLAQVVAASIGLNALALLVPLVNRYLVDRVALGRGTEVMSSVLRGSGFLLLGLLLLQLARVRSLSRLRRHVDLSIATTLLDRLVNLPVVFFAQRYTADVVARMRSVSALRDLLSQDAISILIDGPLLVTFLLVMFALAPLLSLIPLVGGVAQALVYVSFKERRLQVSRERLTKDIWQFSELEQIIRGALTLKASGREMTAQSRWLHHFLQSLDAAIDEDSVTRRASGLLLAVRLLQFPLLVYFGTSQVAAGALSLGTLLALLMLSAAFARPLQSLIEVLLRLHEVPVLLARMDDVLESDPERSDGKQCPALQGRVELTGVCLRYSANAPNVLDDVSIQIAPGQKVALVGPSGSGKSTVAKLLLGLYQPTSGKIAVDGNPLSTLELSSFRRQVGIVLQETDLFRGTVHDNIALGRPGIDRARVEHAARAAQLHERITQLPNGYDTELAGKDARLSGGELQCLALARALASDPALLVLDEASSALDATTEARIEDHLRGLDITRIVVAHRVNTIRDADRIVVMDGGRVAEQGTHEQLIALGGLYARLVMDEASHREDSPDRAPDTDARARSFRPHTPASPDDVAAAAAESASARVSPGPEPASRARRVPVLRVEHGVRSAAACLTAILQHEGRAITLGEVLAAIKQQADPISETFRIGAGQLGKLSRPLRIPVDDLEALESPLVARMRHGYVVLERWRRDRLLAMDPQRGWVEYTRDELERDFEGRAVELWDDPAALGMLPFPTRLRRALGRHQRGLRMVLTTTLLLQGAALAPPILLGLVVDHIFDAQAAGVAAAVSAGLATTACMHVLLWWARDTAISVARSRLDRDVMVQFVRHVLRLPIRFFLRHEQGELLQRFEAVTTLRRLFGPGGVALVTDLPTLGFTWLAMLVIDRALAAAVLGGALALLVFLAAVVPWLHRLTEGELLAARAQQTTMLEVFRSIVSLRVLGHPELTLGRCAPALKRQVEASTALFAAFGSVSAGVAMLVTSLLLLIPAFAAMRVVDGGLSVAGLLAFSGLLGGFLAALEATASFVLMAARLRCRMALLRSTFDAQPEDDTGGGAPVDELDGSVSLRDVRFRHEESGPWVLDGITLDIPAGAKVALVGRSGSGKSTLGMLLLGLHAPCSGEVRFAGRDLRGMDVQSLRTQFGVVLQDNYLFAGTIRSNLSLNDPTSPLPPIREAARTAVLDAFVERLPMGYSTILAPGGHSLSGGERQRLAIARALLHRPAILLLDEATSSLENTCQAQVEANLNRQRCTRIVIAHRLSTVQDADLIVVLDRGKVVESGTHLELMEREGHYARLMADQARGSHAHRTQPLRAE